MVEYPILADYDDDGKPSNHPIVDAIASGGKIESVTVELEWTDDHCPCVNVVATVDGKEYKYSDWWLSREGLKMYHQTECGARLDELTAHIKYYAESE